MRQAVQVLRGGGLIAYPTEAVYGLGCNPLDAPAIERLLELKERPLAHGLILIAASVHQLVGYVSLPGGEMGRRVASTWPGPTTWLLPAAPALPRWLSGGRDSLAVRVTAHVQCAALCNAFAGPLVSTSANRHGRAPARSALGVRRRFGSRIDCIVHGQLGGRRYPSEIRDALTGAVVRPAVPRNRQ